MRISPAQATKLFELKRGASLKRSEIQKELRDDLSKRGAIRLQRAGSGYRIYADPIKLSAVLSNHYGIRNLKEYIALREKSERTRAEVTQSTGNSKSLVVAPMRGIYLGVLGDAEIFINGKPVKPHTGTSLFIPERLLNALTIAPNRILGVENAEAFLSANMLNLKLPSQAVTVLRWYWSDKWKNWIKQNQPETFYAGDYDWAGVSIFENEVLAISPEAKFLIPENIGGKLRSGNNTLFQAQEEKYLNYKPRSVDGQTIFDAVKAARKALEQEALIRLV